MICSYPKSLLSQGQKIEAPRDWTSNSTPSASTPQPSALRAWHLPLRTGTLAQRHGFNWATQKTTSIIQNRLYGRKGKTQPCQKEYLRVTESQKVGSKTQSTTLRCPPSNARNVMSTAAEQRGNQKMGCPPTYLTSHLHDYTQHVITCNTDHQHKYVFVHHRRRRVHRWWFARKWEVLEKRELSSWNIQEARRAERLGE